MAHRRKGNLPNQTGRNNTDRFARLSHKLLSSSAYRSLSPNDRSLLLELTMMENGSNNGSLFLSVRDAADRMGVVDLKAVSRSFDTLMALGFIEMTQDAYFRVKAADHSRARCWRLTWLTGPGKRVAKSPYLTREPEPGTRAHKRMLRGQGVLKVYRKAMETGRLPVVDSDTLATNEAFRPVPAVEDFATPNAGNGGNPPKCRVVESAAHTAVTMGNGEEGAQGGWNQSVWTPHIANLAYLTALTGQQWSVAA